MNPQRIIFAGAGEFGLPSLRALRAAGHEILLVLSQPDKPAGRDRKLTLTPIAQYALTENLALLRTKDINAEILPPADLMVVIAFGQKIAPPIVNHPRLGSINLHSSRLPKYRGAAPINWAILRGETITGNSVIRLADRMDAGEILAQSELPIGETETAGELHDRLANDGAELLPHVVQSLADGTATHTSQDNTQATSAPKLSREFSRLDWSKSAEELARHIRGLSPWPGCRVQLTDAAGKPLTKLALLRARASASASNNLPPGTITATGQITTANNQSLEILALQPEGKRPMPLAAYRNGYPWEEGMLLTNLD